MIKIKRLPFYELLLYILGMGKIKHNFNKGHRFTRLIILRETKKLNKKRRFDCLCDCGRIKNIDIHSLVSGNTQSCGCLGIERRSIATSKRCKKHGESYIFGVTPEYKTWLGMKYRCYNKKSNNFHRYGGRGIKVCDRWKNNYENFLLDVGRRPMKNYTLDRIDNNGNYGPDNVRWTTRKEQARNTRKTIWLMIDGIKKPLQEWCEIYKIRSDLVWARIVRGWASNKDLFQPAIVKYRNKLCQIS